MSEDFVSKLFRGRGRMFISLRDTSSPALPIGWKFIGQIGSASLTPDIQRGQTLETETGADAVAASWPTKTAYNLSMGMRSIRAQHLETSLQGSAVTYAAASVTSEPHIAQQGLMIACVKQDISAVSVTSDPAGTTYDVTDDYIVHAEEGLIEIVVGGAIADDTPILLNYTHTGQKLVSANPDNVARSVMFVGKNTADDDKRVRCTMYKVKLSPGAFDLISDGSIESPITGEIELDTTRTAGDQLFSWLVND